VKLPRSETWRGWAQSAGARTYSQLLLEELESEMRSLLDASVRSSDPDIRERAARARLLAQQIEELEDARKEAKDE